MKTILGFIIVIITIGLGWLSSEIIRPLLLVVGETFQFNYYLNHFVSYLFSSISFAWISIFLPMIIFKKLNISVNWRPSIYFLFIWFALIQYKTSIMILNINLLNDILLKLIVVSNILGVFWILFIAFRSTDKY